MIFGYFYNPRPLRGKWDQDQSREHKTQAIE